MTKPRNGVDRRDFMFSLAAVGAAGVVAGATAASAQEKAATEATQGGTVYTGDVVQGKKVISALDVNDHDQVPKVFAELENQLGGIDRVIVNAGIGKGAPLGSGKLWANKQTIETNLVAALVQIETAIEMFKNSGGGHLVLI